MEGIYIFISIIKLEVEIMNTKSGGDGYENGDDICARLPDPRRRDNGRVEDVTLQLLIECRLEESSSYRCGSSVLLLFGKAYNGGALGVAHNVYAGGGSKSGENLSVLCDDGTCCGDGILFILGEDMGELCKGITSLTTILSDC